MRAGLFFLGTCLLCGLAPLAGPVDSQPFVVESFTGWPAAFEGRILTPATLTDQERSFESVFPGRIGRFSDGERQITMRWVMRPTRLLHRATVCFRGLGYSVHDQPLKVDAQGDVWTSFHAVRDDETLLVRSIIRGKDGQTWPDVSAWFWSATRDPATGPWWAITVAERLPQ